MLAAVGPMQFEVAVHRLENEFGAPVELLPTSYRLARRTDADGAEALKGMRGVRVLRRADGTILALFESQYWVERLEHDQPDLLLERLVAEGSVSAKKAAEPPGGAARAATPGSAKPARRIIAGQCNLTAPLDRVWTLRRRNPSLAYQNL